MKEQQCFLSLKSPKKLFLNFDKILQQLLSFFATYNNGNTIKCEFMKGRE